MNLHHRDLVTAYLEMYRAETISEQNMWKRQYERLLGQVEDMEQPAVVIEFPR